MRKTIVPAAALALVSATAFAAPPPAPAPTTQDQVNRAAQMAVNALGALITQANDNRSTISAMQTLLRSADLSEPKADALKQALQQWITTANQMAQAQVNAAKKEASDAHNAAEELIGKHMKAVDAKSAADAKTIAGLREQIAENTRLLAQGEKMCLPQPQRSEPSHGAGVESPHPAPTKR